MNQIKFEMDPQILKKLEKGMAQLSTGLRTLSKVCGLLSGVGEKKIPELPETEPKFPILKPTPFQLFLRKERFFNPISFLKNPRTLWGITPCNDVLNWVFRSELRSDRFKNAWVLFGKKWGKISQRQYDELFQAAEVFYEECQFAVGSCKSLEEFRKYLKFPEFKQSKWERRDNWGKELTRAHMTTFTREKHDELPSLRGGKS